MTIASKTSPSEWQGVVGLEIHAQIDAESKLFSGSGTSYSAHTNSQVSLFDCATPGTLPVLNRRCVEAAALTALALNCTLHKTSLFDRKHYFYADLPAGYQITQRFRPIATNGWLEYFGLASAPNQQLTKYRVGIEQIQLEQDSGKSLHSPESGFSLIDLNRAGMGLMEIITRPEFANGEQAAAFISELVLILRDLKVCDVKLFEGSLRVDANVSVRKAGEPLGTRSEVKNINSMRFVAKAVDFEIARHTRLREAGEEIVNETRGYDFKTGTTFPMRDKEILQDYRYMPEPNLPPLRLFDSSAGDVVPENQIDLALLRSKLPELPCSRFERYVTQLHLTPSKAALMLAEDGLADLFEKTVALTSSSAPVRVATIFSIDLMGILNERKQTVVQCYATPEQLAALIDMLESQTVPRVIFQKLLILVCRDKTSSLNPMQMIKENNWYQINDLTQLEGFCQQVMTVHPELVTTYKKGKLQVLNKMVDQVKVFSNELANLKSAKQILENLLSKVPTVHVTENKKIKKTDQKG